METLILVGSFLYLVVAGYFALKRLGRFLDEGVISPDDDGKEGENSPAPTESKACSEAASRH